MYSVHCTFFASIESIKKLEVVDLVDLVYPGLMLWGNINLIIMFHGAFDNMRVRLEVRGCKASSRMLTLV